MVNKKYLGAALTVGISTAGGPFMMSSSIHERSIPYLIGAAYFLICSGVGFAEFYENRRNKLLLENSANFCDGKKRYSIEELVSKGFLSLDE